MHHDNFRLGLNDRVRYMGELYRPESHDRKRKLWTLRRLVDGSALDEHPWFLTERDHYRLRRSESILVDEDYFSLAGRQLSGRGDDSDLSDLDEDQQLTVAWKVEWCVRFYRARALLDGYTTKPAVTPKGLNEFVEKECDRVHRWYVATYRKPRPIGRAIMGKPPKPYDYPSGTTLREWMEAYEAAGYKKKAFRPGYHRCGNRNQLNGLVVSTIEETVRGYASRANPAVADIYDKVLGKLDRLNRARPSDDELTVGERAVRRRIRQLSPVVVDAGRLGPEMAGRKYMPVGQGLESVQGLEPLQRMDRVEMDDWEMDLFVLLNGKRMRARLSADARAKAAEIERTARCTVTWALDVVTRSIVGLNVTPAAPSCAGSRGALHTILVDKTPLAKAAKCRSHWSMFCRPREIVTDGGPAFRGEFHDTLERLGIAHRYPGGEPNRRGHVESSFRTLKRFCRMFTGQAFSNVVERGDYESSRCASLLAQELERLLVRFIVDDYHQDPHEGLAGVRPLTAWEKADNDLIDPPDHVQRKLAFGIRLTDRTIDAAGVTFLHIQYKHPKMALLHGHVGRKRLTAIVDPLDLGRILVRVPEEARRGLGGEGDYMTFTAREEFRGVSILRHTNNSGALRALEREEEAKGRPFRLEAQRALAGAAEKARRRAGVAPDELSAENYLKLVERFERAGVRATRPRPAPAGPPMTADGEPDVLGRSIAQAPDSIREVRPVTPAPARPRSINRYKEDEQ